MFSVLIVVLLRTHRCCTLTSSGRQRVIGAHLPFFEFVPPRVHLPLPLDSAVRVHHYWCSTNCVSFMSSDRKYRARDWCSSLVHVINAVVLVESQYSHYSVHKWKLTAYKFCCSRNIQRCFHKQFESKLRLPLIFKCFFAIYGADIC
jgi:hypothetical protein